MNGRMAKAARRALRERNEQLLAAIRDAEPVFQEAHGRAWESWTKGPAMLFVPILCDDYSPELKEMVVVRRQAAFTGACPCGAVGRITEAGSYDMPHESGCPAAAGVFQALHQAGRWRPDMAGGVNVQG
ncbi:hypothetical protein [Streptomyces sp. NPDC048663]|uniref:hypothetical protein n=1 Tax=Streptomyces sp. NPDC048663 TaxID=3155638 RepID=UPI00343B19CE